MHIRPVAAADEQRIGRLPQRLQPIDLHRLGAPGHQAQGVRALFQRAGGERRDIRFLLAGAYRREEDTVHIHIGLACLLGLHARLTAGGIPGDALAAGKCVGGFGARLPGAGTGVVAVTEGPRQNPQRLPSARIGQLGIVDHLGAGGNSRHRRVRLGFCLRGGGQYHAGIAPAGFLCFSHMYRILSA